MRNKESNKKPIDGYLTKISEISSKLNDNNHIGSRKSDPKKILGDVINESYSLTKKAFRDPNLSEKEQVIVKRLSEKIVGDYNKTLNETVKKDKMKKVRINERDLVNIVKKVIRENSQTDNSEPYIKKMSVIGRKLRNINESNLSEKRRSSLFESIEDQIIEIMIEAIDDTNLTPADKRKIGKHGRNILQTQKR